jgi:hypothetical protein
MSTVQAFALREKYTAERSWTADRVCDAIRAAWAAHPRTQEHSRIMGWPGLYLPTDSDARNAIHMVGLKSQNPEYSLRALVTHRLHWSWNKFSRARERGCSTIAEKLNAGLVPLIIVVERRAA